MIHLTHQIRPWHAPTALCLMCRDAHSHALTSQSPHSHIRTYTPYGHLAHSHRNLHMAGQADPNPLNGAKRRRKIKLLHLTIDSLLGFGQVANCPRPQFPHLSSERCNRWFLNSFPALEPLPEITAPSTCLLPPGLS